ncbi:MAG: metallophosphoesterase [Rhodoferax sp.]|uniref:metallophosphoesterase family protein n=1 Tax=Rhodoferax sp. TaxID=50421 RepID=UPI001B6E8D36|nr:metallophosphoesterase family protein [Rhodoferax sp.]MBP9906654.1 metallophosphoesterase [Rhodoferax sp.]
MSVLLHLSDTHFGTEQPQVVEALVTLAAQQRPDVVVLSGDITQRASPAQFRAAKAFVDRLGAPVLAIPGNHDIPLFDLWARLTRPYAGFASVFGADLEPVYSAPDGLVLGVNTTRAWRHRHGQVSGAQMARVARLLAAAKPDQLRVVVVHQPLAVADASESVHLLRGHARAAQLWAQAGADLVLGGHIHLPFTLPLPGLARHLWVVQAGTAVSGRTRLGVPNSVNLLRWGHAVNPPQAVSRNRAEGTIGCTIERWDFAADQQAFVRTTVKAVTFERAHATPS